MSDLAKQELEKCKNEINGFRAKVESEIIENVLSKFKADEVQLSHYPASNGFSIMELSLKEDNTHLVTFQHKIDTDRFQETSCGFSRKIKFIYKVEYNKNIFN